MEYEQRLVRLAWACGAGPDTARDIVQEAFVRTVAGPRLDPDRFGPYLSTVVRRLVVDAHRQEVCQCRLAEHCRLEPAPDPGPEDGVCDRVEAEWLAGQTRPLRVRDRDVLHLRAGGRTTSEVAAELRMSTKTVEMVLRRARIALALAVTG